jgi:hypothetical protein
MFVIVGIGLFLTFNAIQSLKLPRARSMKGVVNMQQLLI